MHGWLPAEYDNRSMAIRVARQHGLAAQLDCRVIAVPGDAPPEISQRRPGSNCRLTRVAARATRRMLVRFDLCPSSRQSTRKSYPITDFGQQRRPAKLPNR